MARTRIRQSDIEPGPDMAAMRHTVALIKALSAAGYVWRVDEGQWFRARDGGVVTGEFVEALAMHWPVFIAFAVKMLSTGARGLMLKHERTQEGGLVVTLAGESLLESVAKAAS